MPLDQCQLARPGSRAQERMCQPVWVAQDVMATADAHYLEAGLFERADNA